MPPAYVLTAILAAAALAGGLYLVSRGFSPAARPGCGAAGGCDAVLASRWSRLARLPVSVLAAAVYAGMFGAAVGTQAGRGGREALLALSISAIGAAIWFTALQLLVIRRFCRFCMLTHALAVAAGVAAFVAAGPPAASLYLVGGGLVGLLVLLQLLFPARTYTVELPGPSLSPDPHAQPAPPQPAPPAAARTIALHGGAINLDLADWPLLGPPAASTVIAELFDYTCQDCRHTHHLMRQAMQRYTPHLAVLLIPVPLEPVCNPAVWELDPRHVSACEYARMALAVWTVRPDLFLDFHHWLMGSKVLPSVLVARSHAGARVGPSGFAAALRDPRIDRMVGAAVDLYRKAQSGNLPKLILPRAILWGRIPDPKQFFEVLEQNTTLGPSAASVAGGTSIA